MAINNKSERNYRGKCLGWPVTSYGGDNNVTLKMQETGPNLKIVFLSSFSCLLLAYVFYHSM